MKNSARLLVVLAAISVACSSSAQLFTYGFSDVVSGSTYSAGGTANNLTFSNFTSSGIGASATAGNVFSFNGWSLGATNGSNTFAGGLDLTDYYEFSVTPDSGHNFSLTEISFAAGRSSTGVRQFAVRSNADGYTSNLSATAAHSDLSVITNNIFQFIDNDSSANRAGNSITLTGSAFTSLTTARTFRIYAFNAEGNAGTFRVDNLAVSGSTAVIPEPSTYAAILGAVALIGVAVHRQRQRRAQRGQ